MENAKSRSGKPQGRGRAAGRLSSSSLASDGRGYFLPNVTQPIDAAGVTLFCSHRLAFPGVHRRDVGAFARRMESADREERDGHERAHRH